MSISSTPGVVLNGSPWDQVNHDVYDVRARLAHWLLHYSFPPGDRNRLRMVQDPEAAELLAQAETAGAVSAEVANAYRVLIEARKLADGPPDGVTDAEVAVIRERYGVVRAWLDEQAKASE